MGRAGEGTLAILATNWGQIGSGGGSGQPRGGPGRSKWRTQNCSAAADQNLISFGACQGKHFGDLGYNWGQIGYQGWPGASPHPLHFPPSPPTASLPPSPPPTPPTTPAQHWTATLTPKKVHEKLYEKPIETVYEKLFLIHVSGCFRVL